MRQRGMLNVDADVTDRWLVQGASAPRVLRSRSSRTSQTRGFWTTSRNGSKWTSRSCRKKSISPLTVSKRTSCYATWFTAGRATHRSLWCHWWRHNLETIRDREKRRPTWRTKSCELSNGENRIALRQLLENRKWRHLWRHNLGSRWKLQKMAWENFSIGAFYNITKNQDNPIKTVGRDSFLSPKTPKNTSF